MFSRISVRPVKATDIESILEIEGASFGREAYDRKLFAEFTRRCGGLFLIASKGNKVFGYSITCIRGDRAELVSIAVHPRHRNCGTATALMDSTLRRLRRRGVIRFVLMVKGTNRRALALYEKYGFRRYRRVPGYYGDTDDADGASDGFLYVKLL